MCRLNWPTTILAPFGREQLNPAALKALQLFYAADWAFFELALQMLGPMESDAAMSAA